MYAGPLRLLRALTVSATCVALSFAAHLAGAGTGLPPLPLVAGVGLLMTIVLVTLVLAALSGRRWTLGRSLVALALGQVVLHAAFTVLVASGDDPGMAAMGGGASMVLAGFAMVLAHSVAALLIGVGIAVNDSALDTYFSLASSRVGSGIRVLSPWCLAGLISGVYAAAEVRASGRGERLSRWQRPRILTDLVVLQCLSRRGPPALALAI